MYQPARLPSLDGWRALAIAMVVLSHFTAVRGFAEPWGWTHVFQGNLGVRIFFVISGLLITFLLLRETDYGENPSLKSFYTRRVLRIFPVYFVYLAFVAGLAATGWYSETRNAWIGSLTFTRNFIGQPQSLTGHYWSLSVEEQFYLVWPMVLVALRLWERPRLGMSLLLIPIVVCPIVRTNIVSVTWQNEWVAHAFNLYSTARYADSLAVGCVGAFAYWQYRGSLAASAPPWTLAAALLVFALASAETGRAGAWEPLLPLIQAVAILCAIYMTIERRSGLLYWLLNTPVMIWLGVLSYSLYVWQELFVAWSAGPKLAALAVYDWRVWWAAALACASASYYLVEKPILRIRDRFRPASRRPRESTVSLAV